MKRKHKQFFLNIYFIGIIIILGIISVIELTRYEKGIITRRRVIYSSSGDSDVKDVLKTVSSLVSTRGKQDELVTKPKSTLNFSLILNVSECAKSDIVQQLPNDILAQFLQLPDVKYVEEICILTPVRNAARSLIRYRRLIGNLNYPHHLISVYFGEDGSTDNTFEKANATANYLRVLKKFNSTKVVELDIFGGFQYNRENRHDQKIQKLRRSHMALARNRLLRFALRQKKFDYILWIDNDLVQLPADIIQQMLFAKSDVVATSCLMKSKGYKMKYDRNSWRETNASLTYQSKLKPDGLVLEGYRKSLRYQLPDLKSEGRIVKLDGVGGCALMVKADCHRSGLHFPEIVYKHHIETEGLAKLALDMGFDVVGLPFVEVFHV